MKLERDLVFGIANEVTGIYGGVKKKYHSMKFSKYLHELKRQVIRNPKDFVEKPFKKYAYITGKVRSGLLPMFDKYLMLLDSDNVDDAEEALKWLNEKQIRNFKIESSPGHFWIVCDKVGTVSENVYMMDEIPGLDTRYNDCSKQQNILLYRGFPKPGFMPKFDDTSTFTGFGVFEKWILNFKKYWELDEIQDIANYLFVEAL